jgi:hypothetical protein
MCELETKRRVIRLHVSQITAVKYETDSDRRAAYISYPDGKRSGRQVDARLRDFLNRLTTLNPAVTLTGFPTNWQPLGDRTRERRDPSLSRFVRDSTRSAARDQPARLPSKPNRTALGI